MDQLSSHGCNDDVKVDLYREESDAATDVNMLMTLESEPLNYMVKLQVDRNVDYRKTSSRRPCFFL